MPDDIQEKRAKAIADNGCYSKSRLRDDFRMKPATNAEPVTWYKNDYGMRYAIYRITDCVVMKEKKTPTTKQVAAGKKLGILSKMNSVTGLAAKKAYDILKRDPLALDTETTGLGDNAEAIEIGLVNIDGEIVFSSRLYPVTDIEPIAQEIHGISKDSLIDAPTWLEISNKLRELIGNRPVIIFNEPFDIRILKQTAAAHGDNADWLNGLDTHCAMKIAADFYGATNRHGSISLANSAKAAGLVWEGQAHSAVADSIMTIKVLKAIAVHYQKPDCS